MSKTVSKAIFIEDEGTYDLTISLWKAPITINTSSTEFYNQTITVTSNNLSTAETITFNSSGVANYVAYAEGVYTFSVTVNGLTNKVDVRVTAQQSYTATLNKWMATVSLSTVSSELAGAEVLITSGKSTETIKMRLPNNTTDSIVFKAGIADDYTFRVKDNRWYNKYYSYTKTLSTNGQTESISFEYLKLVTWADGTDAEICKMIAAMDDGFISTYDSGWDENDERIVHLNAISSGSYNVAHAAQNITLVLVRRGGYYNLNKGNFVVAFKECIKEAEKIETSATNQNGWHNSRGKKCCDAIFNMIPSTLRPIFKEFTVHSSTKGGSNSPGVSDATGKLSLFQEKDVFDPVTYESDDEYRADWSPGQFNYFKTAANRTKVRSGTTTASMWWLRTPSKDSTSAFVNVTSAGAVSYGSASYSSCYMAPFGVI